MGKIATGALFIAVLACLRGSGSTSALVGQGTNPDNECVRCHSALLTPSGISDRFLDWRASRHAAAGVTCEKCHGGNPASRDAVKAHAGVLRPSDKKSRLNDQNAPESCGVCHRRVANAFVESEHFRRLEASELGPGCVSCHGHMGSSAAHQSFEVESLCTFCHNTVNGLLPPRPDIVKKAKATLDAIARTNYMVGWINELIEQADRKKLDAAAEKEELRLLKMTLSEAKASWHAFALDIPLAKATKSFNDAVVVKDRLIRKLGQG